MTKQDQQDGYIKSLAHEAIASLTGIADAARYAFGSHRNPSDEALAPADIETTIRARKNLTRISQQLSNDYLTLVREPAIARVVAVDENGKEQVYYICRGTPIGGATNLASYRAPIGRLAALPIGAEIDLPSGLLLELAEKALLYPKETDKGWDSIDSIAETGAIGPLTIASLRRLVDVEIPIDDLEELLREEERAANIAAGIRRIVIDKMSLRDQPILDQYQDEIFRLPLSQGLLLLGPPGTGKTTTLIRRLGQKLDSQFLDDDEKAAISSVHEGGGLAHDKSWLMFTPTELLKQYLKEAFALEGVPAPDTCIKTWSEYQRMTARNTFGLLRTATNRGAFVLRDSEASLTRRAVEESLDWAEDFISWQADLYLADLRVAADALRKAPNKEASVLGAKLSVILQEDQREPIATTMAALATNVEEARRVRDSSRQEVARVVEGSLRALLSRNRSFLDELAQFVAEEDRASAAAEEVDDDDGEEEDREVARNPRAIAKQAFEMAIREHARALAAGRTIRRGRRSARVIEWLAGRVISDEDLLRLAGTLETQRASGRFVDPVRRYFRGCPQRYRRFRRAAIETRNDTWYVTASEIVPDEIGSLELDVVLLCCLRSAREFLTRPGMETRRSEPAWAELEIFRALYRNQVLVDETTDFSQVQLACMAAVCHPRVLSFFACGDFDQRLTVWGTRTLEQIQRVLPSVSVKRVQIGYRQSRQLSEFARELVRIGGGQLQEVTLPQRVDSDGVAPTLMENAGDLTSTVRWLAKRIVEIERFIGKLPSIAVFVPDENSVEDLAAQLSRELSEINTQAVACVGGRIIGQDNDVRVFDIQHIKGLEFEAVFFVGLDTIADTRPLLFDRFLYVGATRAATYLGLTCFGKLPAKLDELRSSFVSGWGGI